MSVYLFFMLFIFKSIMADMSVYLFFIFFILKSIMADECIRGAYKEHAKAKTMTQGIRGTKTMTCTMSLLNAMRD